MTYYIDYPPTGGMASISSMKLSGAPAVGGYLLNVTASITMEPAARERRAPRLLSFTGHLDLCTAGGWRIFVAALDVTFVDLEAPPDQAPTRDVVLRSRLTPAQVRALDEQRTGDGGFDLQITLACQVTGHAGAKATKVAVPHHVTSSDWTRALAEMQFEDRVTFEMPVGGGRVGPPFDRAAEQMRAAIAKLQLRQWDDVLVKCREVFFELEARFPRPSDARRKDWTLSERISAVAAEVRHLTHAGAHAEIGTPTEDHAHLAVTMTALLLRYVASPSTWPLPSRE
jgi:hypothetical protein